MKPEESTSPQSYCPGCMSQMAEHGVCGDAACQWHAAQPMESFDHLPRHFVLMDRYYIGRVLGHGGFGVTYMARDLKLDDLVAVKEFLPREQCSRLHDRVTVGSHGGEKAEAFHAGIDGFMNEAKTLVKLAGHPNILAVKDVEKANGTAYLVMEYLSGRTLKQYVQSQGGRIPPTVAVDIMLHVMSGLRKVHANGLLYRDVSPDNIMITEAGPVKLLDFGSARSARFAVGEHSRSLSVILKPGYSPEEQYRTRGKQGAWTDVYAVAATLYRCITGQVPPPSLDRLSDAEDGLLKPSLFCPGLDAGLEAAILKGLALRAADRFQNIEDFQQALLATRKPTVVEWPTFGSEVHPSNPDEGKSLEKDSSSRATWTTGRQTMFTASLITTISSALWIGVSIYSAVKREYFTEALYLLIAVPILVSGFLFFISCTFAVARIAKNGWLRWAAGFYLICELFSQGYSSHVLYYVHWGLLTLKTAVDVATLLFLIPIVFGVEKKAVRMALTPASMAALTWQFYDQFHWSPVQAPTVTVELLNLSWIIFLALSIKYGLPDAFARRPTRQTARGGN